MLFDVLTRQPVGEARMKVRLGRWYWLVWVIWLGTGLPIYVVGEGFAGPEHGAFTVDAFLRSLIPQTGSLEVFAGWGIGTTLILLPVLSFPFAIRLIRQN